MTGEVLAEEGTLLSREQAREIACRGVHGVVVESNEGEAIKVFGNGMVNGGSLQRAGELQAEELVEEGLLILKMTSGPSAEEMKQAIHDRMLELVPKTIIVETCWRPSATC